MPFNMKRLDLIVEPEPGNAYEVGGILNPAAARGPDGELYLFPRIVAENNYSRIGILKVLFDDRGEPCGVERMGIALEPEMDYEMRPNGQNMIRIFRSHESAPASLPFDKWSESVFGSDFNYEDFLQPEYYWQGQTILKSARFGARDCDVLKSTPGALDHSHYAEVQTWLDHTIGYPIYVEKTLKDGGIVKEFTYFGLSQSGGVWSARQVEVKIHGRPGSTLLIIERGSTKANLSIRDFSPEQISQFEDRP